MDVFKPIFKIFWKNVGKADDKRVASQTPPSGVTCINDIPYVDDGDKYHLLDIYYPNGTDKPLPLIIDIHGGGWWYGTKEINKHYCMALSKKGFVVVNINYRLVDSVTIIDQLRDVFSCLKWVSENMHNHYADLKNIFITGDSAGGHLCSFTAQINTDKKMMKKLDLEDNSLDFKAVAVTSPAVDLLSSGLMMRTMLNSFLGTTHHKKSPYYFLASFENVASKNLPPFYIVTSSGDFVRKQAHKLHNMLDGLGVENKISDFTERYKGKPLGHVFSVIDPYIAPSIKVIDELTEFFKSHID